tara:strand:- start:1541 stop:1744 length:204 start_codon:yes stop_codon:yes gene_type:complete
MKYIYESDSDYTYEDYEEGSCNCDKCGILGDFQGGGVIDGIFYAHLLGSEDFGEYVLCTECIEKENK